MAGHSHSANIAVRKGKQDKARAKPFSKLARYIMIAAKNGPDPAMNPRLRLAVEAAKKASMTRDTLERAIKKGAGLLDDAATFETVVFEGFAPHQVPVIVRGDLVGRDGQGQFKLRSAEVNGLTVPRSLALDLLANHTRTRDNPKGFDIEKPFDLPLKIRELNVRDGELWVVQ